MISKADPPACVLALRRIRRSVGEGAMVGFWAVLVTVVFSVRAGAGLQTEQRTGHLFPPENLGLLESPDRAAWQKPDQIMDALGVADGSKVADIGAGAGWFTVQLARRVGPNGLVYAQDIQRQMLEAIRRRVSREGLQNVRTVMASNTDPNLPRSAVDAILVVDVYPEVEDRVTFLRSLSLALRPNGRIGVVNYKPGQGGPGPSSEANEGIRVDASVVEADARAAGLRVLARENLPFQYLIVLGT
jgi:SAM-dependent methyltransferase